MTQVLSVRQPARVELRAYLALAFGVVCIALSAIFVKWAAVPGPVAAFYRILFPALVLIPWWLSRRPKSLSRAGVGLSVLAGVSYALELALWNMSLLLTSAATATLFVNLAPLWVGLASLLLFRERLPAAFWLGMAVALGGVLAILGGNLLQNPVLGRGELLALGSSVLYAGYLMATARARVHLGTVNVITLSVLSGCLVLFLLCLVLRYPLTGFSTRTWASLLALGLISHLGGMLGINYALGHIRTANASVSLLAHPVLTALFAIPLLGEFLSVQQLVGGALVLVGIYLVHRPAKTHALEQL